MYVVCTFHDYRFFYDYLAALHPYLQHTVIPNVTKIDPDETYLFVLSIPEEFLACPNVMYLNTEQLSQPRWYTQVQSYLERGIRVLDYDLFQSQITDSLLHQYLPYPYESHLTELVRTTPKVHDVAICSINSDRRHAMAVALHQRGVDVVDIHDWGESRDRRIAQCRILLNVHYTEQYQIFEHVRCDRWIMAGMRIVTEPSLSDPLLDVAPFMTIVAYEKMADTVVRLLSSSNEEEKKLDALRQARHEQCTATVSHLKNFKNFKNIGT